MAYSPDEQKRLSNLAIRMNDIQQELSTLQGYDKLTGKQENHYTQLTSELESRRQEVALIKRPHELGEIRSLAMAGHTEGGSAGTHYIDGSMPASRPEDRYGVNDPGNVLGDSRAPATRDQARRVIDQAHRSQGLPDYAAERATALLDQGKATDRSQAARWVAAAGAPAYRTAFAKMMQDPTRGHLLWTEEEGDAYRAAHAVALEMRAIGLVTGLGSAMVPLTLDPAILLTNAGTINPLRDISRVVQTVSSTWQGVTSAGATAEWKAEHIESADGSPVLVSPSIPVYMGDVDVPHSYEVAMDAVDFLEELRVVMLDAAALLQATAYTLGSGVAQPTGIITALPAGSTVASAAADTFAKGDVYALQNALPARFQGNARWCAALATINTMSQYETTAGARLFPELSEGRLLNRPIHELSDMDGVINAGAENYILLYGDFRNFVVVDRVGATLEILPGYGANRRPTAERHAFLTFRTGSDAVVDNAFRRLNVT